MRKFCLVLIVALAAMSQCAADVVSAAVAAGEEVLPGVAIPAEATGAGAITEDTMEGEGITAAASGFISALRIGDGARGIIHIIILTTIPIILTLMRRRLLRRQCPRSIYSGASLKNRPPRSLRMSGTTARNQRPYYPYVKECPGGWQTVPVQPPSGTGR